MENLSVLHDFQQALKREGLRESSDQTQNFVGYYTENEGGVNTYDDLGSENYAYAGGKPLLDTTLGKIGLGVASAGAGFLAGKLISDADRKKQQQEIKRANEAADKVRQELESQKKQSALDKQAAADALAALNQPPAPPKSKTMLYVGIGVGALALLGIIIAVSRRN